jgi:hypothetical protein
VTVTLGVGVGFVAGLLVGFVAGHLVARRSRRLHVDWHLVIDDETADGDPD